MNEKELRERMAMHGRSLFERGLSGGSSGNISARLEDGFLMTPTNSCLGRLDPERISRVDPEGEHVAGDRPSKEVFLHLAMYRERPEARAVVHLHCTHLVALSCLADVDPENALPPITPYYIMRVGSLPLVPYFRPGDKTLAEGVRKKAGRHPVVLLANHGPVVSGKSLEAAVYAAEELEETAKLYLMLRGMEVRILTEEQVAELREVFPSR